MFSSNSQFGYPCQRGGGGGEINQPGQPGPHPSDKDNQTEHWMQTFQFDQNNVYISYN